MSGIMLCAMDKRICQEQRTQGRWSQTGHIPEVGVESPESRAEGTDLQAEGAPSWNGRSLGKEALLGHALGTWCANIGVLRSCEMGMSLRTGISL